MDKKYLLQVLQFLVESSSKIEIRQTNRNLENFKHNFQIIKHYTRYASNWVENVAKAEKKEKGICELLQFK